MQVIAFTRLDTPENEALSSAIVARGGVVVYPTDTLYGLGGNFYDPRVSLTIDRIKNRNDMPYSVVVADKDMLQPLVAEIPPVFDTLYEKLLPGKFTFLFPVSPHIDPVLVKGSSKIGIRIPALPPLLSWVKRLGVPLLSTSVNRSGYPALNDPVVIQEEFAGLPAAVAIDLLIDNGPLPVSAGSTILDLTQSPMRCIRAGDESARAQLNALGIPMLW